MTFLTSTCAAPDRGRVQRFDCKCFSHQLILKREEGVHTNISNSFIIPTNTPERRQSKTLLTIDKRGSKIARNSIFDCYLSPVRRKMVSKTLFLMIIDLILR